MSLDYPNRAIWLAYRKPMARAIRIVYSGAKPYVTGRNAAKRFMREAQRISRANEVASRPFLLSWGFTGESHGLWSGAPGNLQNLPRST